MGKENEFRRNYLSTENRKRVIPGRSCRTLRGISAVRFQVGDGTKSGVTATGSWDMSVGSETDCVLKIYWDAAGAEAYMGMVDKISITLTAEQID